MPARLPCRLCTGPYAAPLAWYQAMSDKEDYVNCPLFRTLCLVRRMGRGDYYPCGGRPGRTVHLLGHLHSSTRHILMEPALFLTVAFLQHVARIRATLWRNASESRLGLVSHGYHTLPLVYPHHWHPPCFISGSAGNSACKEDTMAVYQCSTCSYQTRTLDKAYRHFESSGNAPRHDMEEVPQPRQCRSCLDSTHGSISEYLACQVQS